MSQYTHKMFAAGPSYFGNLAPKAPTAPTASQNWTSGILRPSAHNLSNPAPASSQYKHKMFAAGPGYYGSDPTPGWKPTYGPTVRDDIGQGPTPIPSEDWYRDNLGSTSQYGSGKSDWEMDDDTRDFLTDAFNTLNQEEEAYGGGGGSSGGGGGGGLGGQFSGGPGTQHGTTWSFGKRPSFKPQGIF